MPQPPLLKDKGLIHDPTNLILVSDDPNAIFHVHKLVIMCISPYFQKLFHYSKSPLANAPSLVVEKINLPGLSHHILNSIVNYAYSGHLKPNEDDIEDLIAAADKYNIPGIIKVCTDFLENRLNETNCFGMYMFASSYHCDELKKAAEMFILKSFESVVEISEEFQSLTTKSCLQELLKNSMLYVSDEMIIWNSLVKWMMHNENERFPHFHELCQSVRFGLIHSHVLQSDVLLHPYVQRCERTKKLLDDVIKAKNILESLSCPGQSITLSPSMDIKKHITPRYPRDVIFVFGGRAIDVEFVSPEPVVEVYDHRAERWRQVDIGDPLGPRDHHQITAVGHEIFVLGGHHGPFNVYNSCRKLNIVSKKWSEIAPMKEKRAFLASAVLGNHIYAIGGYNGAWRVESVERYDVQLNQWTSVQGMHERRSGAGAAVLHEKIYVVGGFRDLSYLNSAEFYVPENNQWTIIANMNKPRSSPSVVRFSDYIYVFGGLTSNGLLSSGEKYNPFNDSWTPLERDMVEKKCSAATVVLENKILIIGGWNGFGGLRTVELWCDKNKRWALGTKLIKRRTGCAACVISDPPDIQDYAWPSRENLMEERLMNALGLEGSSQTGPSNLVDRYASIQANPTNNEPGNDNNMIFPHAAAPNGINDILDID